MGGLNFRFYGFWIFIAVGCGVYGFSVLGLEGLGFKVQRFRV